MDLSMLKAARVVAFKDSQPFRRSVFAYLASNRRVVRTVVKLHGLLGRSWLGSLMVAGYGLRSFVGVAMPVGSPAVLAIAAYRNERRQFDWLARITGEEPGQIDVSGRTLLRGAGWWALLRGLARWRIVRFYLRQVHRINQRGDFLVAARVASTLAFYLRLREPLERSTASTVWVSSDSNPYAMALAYAAKSAGKKVVYVTHGHIPEGPPRAEFDLSLLDGPACEDVYRRSQGLFGPVVYKGVEGEHRPMSAEGVGKEGPTIGIFMSLITDWTAFAALLPRIVAKLQPSKLVLRMHPNKVIRDPNAMRAVASVASLEVSDGDRPLLEDAVRCDLVVAGNTSCHLTLLKYGVPTVYVRGLDLVPHDFYRFIEDRIVPAFDAPEDIDLDAVQAFYQDPGWPARFGRFDAGYPAGDCEAGVAAAVNALIRA